MMNTNNNNKKGDKQAKGKGKETTRQDTHSQLQQTKNNTTQTNNHPITHIKPLEPPIQINIVTTNTRGICADSNRHN